MAIKIYVRQGGGAASNPDLAGETPPLGIPIFDGNTPLIEMGQKWEQGQASIGSFTFNEPDANSGYRFQAHATVRLHEDASGTDYILAYHRIEGGNDAGRRSPYVGGDEIDHTVQTMDCNLDLRGLPFDSEVSRPAETSWERTQWLFAAKYNGSSSTRDPHRATTTITCDSFTNDHLVDDTTPVDLDAKDYPVGTFPEEILADIMEEWGMGYGVTLHHEAGVGTHRCLLVLDPLDQDTFQSAVKISDNHLNWDPDHATAPVFEPIWRRSRGRLVDNADTISGLISIYGGINDEPRSVSVETGDAPEDFEVWWDVYNDDLAETEAQATRRANYILGDRRRPYVTHQPSILMGAEQVHLITAGQSIECKSVVMQQGALRHSYIWRRIVEIRWEPNPDGRWWAHLELERPRNNPPRRGGGQPGSTTPKPPPECVDSDPGGIGSDVAGADLFCISGGSVESNCGSVTGSTVCWQGSTTAHSGDTTGLTAGFYYSEVQVTTKYGGYAPTSFIAHISGGGNPEISIVLETVTLVQCRAGGDWTTLAGVFELPSGYTTVNFWLTGAGGRAVLQGSHIFAEYTPPGDPVENDPDCVPNGENPDSTGGGGTSPFYARVDDPRFTNDDQHLITRIRERVINNSGGDLLQGAVVVPDTSFDGQGVTTTSTADTTASMVGVLEDDIADDAQGIVVWSGVTGQVNVTGTAADGDYLFTSTTPGEADTSATRATGAFGRVIRDASGVPLYTLLWGVPDSGGGGHVIEDAGTPLTQRASLNFGDGFDLADDSGNDETDISIDFGSGSTQVAAGDHTHAGGSSAKASATGDLTVTGTAQDVTGATLSLAAGTYIVAGNFDVVVQSNTDRTFEGILDVGGTDENDLAVLTGVGLDTDDRLPVVQHWRVTLGSTTTVKLQARYSGGTTGDFRVEADNTTLTAWTAGGSGAPSDAEYVTTATNGTLSAEVAIPGLAGHPGIAGLGGGGITEEYDSSTTGLTWSPTTPGTINSDTTVPSHLYLEWTGSGAAETLGLRAWSPSGAAAFDARTHVAVQKANDTTTGALGLIVTSSSDTNRTLIQALVNGRGTTSFQAFTYTGGAYTQRGSDWTGHSTGKDFYLRITRDGSNNVSFYWSATGRVWTLVATQAFTFTVANLGYRLSEGNTTTVLAMSDWLRTDV